MYSEVMPYVAAVWNELVTNCNCELQVVHWDRQKLTPYEFHQQGILQFNRSSETVDSMRKRLYSFSPDLVYVSGRMDTGYLAVAQTAKKDGLPVVMGSDKQWHGSLKDYVARFFQKYLYRPYFTHAWVPGENQQEYALRVGFKKENIQSSLYSGNVPLFNSIFLRHQLIRGQTDVLFIGRLHKVKGVHLLIEALEVLKRHGVFRGKLWLYGDGPLKDSIPERAWILKKGFTDQSALEEGILSAAVFCLPSLAEPWGVVLHEMAAAGLPLCCSEACGASTQFLINGYNGYIFKTGVVGSLTNSLEKILTLPDDELQNMAKRSHELAQTITPQSSALSLLSMIPTTGV